MNVTQHFEARDPKVKRIYDRVVNVSESFGAMRQDPKKTSIHLTHRTAFAGVAVRKDAIVLTIKSAWDIPSARIAKREKVSANRWHLEVRLNDPKDVDPELTSWLQAAYEISG